MDTKERLKEFISTLKIPVSAFEKRCGMSNGYISSMRKGLGEEKLNNVLKQFPELSREWLLYGEGDMLRPHVSQSVSGDHNTQVAGNGNSVNTGATLDRAIEEIAEQRKLVAKTQEQVDRLLGIIERMQSR